MVSSVADLLPTLMSTTGQHGSRFAAASLLSVLPSEPRDNLKIALSDKLCDDAAKISALFGVPPRNFPGISSKSEPGTDAKASRKSSPAVDKPATLPKSKPQMSLEESAILNAIPSTGITLERLAFITKLPASNVAEATMSLRLKKLIRFLPGNRVAPLSDGALVD